MLGAGQGLLDHRRLPPRRLAPLHRSARLTSLHLQPTCYDPTLLP